MSDLTTREGELVALGAALGSNCVPCIEHHIPQARKVGLTDQEIHAAIRLADQVRQVPARKVFEAALRLLPPAAGSPADADETIGRMAAMMSGMTSSCGGLASSARSKNAPASEPKVSSSPEGGHGCC